VDEMGIDLLSMCGHKVYGPKGIGALYVRRRRPQVRLLPILHGGGHERGLRSGTLNVPGIVGMGEAFEIAGCEMERDAAHTEALRDTLETRLMSSLDEVTLNGHPQMRLPNNLNLSFRYVESEDLLKELPDVALSTGAACSSASLEPSHVIISLGAAEERAQSSIRFGLGRFNTEEEVSWVADAVIHAVRKLREASPLHEMATRSRSHGGPTTRDS
jgi:cysteine desulfurase